LQKYEQHEEGTDHSWGVPENDSRWEEWLASENRVSVSYPTSYRSWTSVDGRVEVAIKVCSDLKDSEEECPTCRLLMLTGCLSVF
jgi:hypothetical protein